MQLTQKEIEQFKQLPTGNVCDANGKIGNMDAGIKPVDPKSKLVGPAITVVSSPADNLALHRAIYEAEPGSVLVINAHGYTNAGPFGDIMVTASQARGIAGVVIDGTCRDSNDIQESGFPMFSRGFNPGGTGKEDLGTIGGPIQCGGVTVRQGDLIVADRDGVVVIEQEKIHEVLKRALAIFDKEIKVREMLAQGKTTLEIYGFDKIVDQKLEKLRG
jgi:4-hydroxy-4-methyl-2-oxoglutarate aldolase